MEKQDLKEDMLLLHKGYENNSYSVSFYFEYEESKNKRIDFAEATLDSATGASMVERILNTFKDEKINDSDFEKFDILKQHKSAISYSPKNQFENARKIITNLESGEYAEDLTVLGKNLGKAKGVIVKIVIDTEDVPFFAFMGINKFNAFKKRSLSDGLIATIDSDGVHRIDDAHKMFGIRDEIGFYYHNGNFVINSHTVFERMLCLSVEYKNKAEKTVNNLAEKFPSILIGVKNLKKDLVGRGSLPLERTLAKVSIESLEQKFNSDNLRTSLERLKDIAGKKEFKDKLRGVEIDDAKGTITYSSDAKFGYAALLSDRPSETLFLGRKFME